MLRNQLYGRICIVQKMMLEAVKSAQRKFPTRIFYKEEAASLIKIGDKGIEQFFVFHVLPPTKLWTLT